MFVYSVKFVCGVQKAPATTEPQCTPVRPGIYSTEINIHNYQATATDVEKRAVLLVHDDAPVGIEPNQKPLAGFDKIALRPDSATMDNCCNLSQKLQFQVTRLNIGFLEIRSKTELVVTAVYTASDLKAASLAIDVQNIIGHQV